MVNKRVMALAPDLTKNYPKLTPLGNYKIIATHALDKCEAELPAPPGSYHFQLPTDQTFFQIHQND